jgi:nucleotide-binding universal stress UspA family protein
MNERGWILVPLDGTRGAERSLTLAGMLARVYDLRLDVVHVLDPTETSAEVGTATTPFEDYGARLVLAYGLPGETRFRTVAGPTAPTLIGIARESAMVVMASHGRGGFRAMILGSVADKVVRSSECPVVLVPTMGDGTVTPRTILVPLDGSSVAEQALPHARRLAEGFGAQVVLMRAFNAIVMADVEFGYYDVPLSLLDDVQAYLDSVALPGEKTVVFEGDPTNAIVATVEDERIDMVVMTSSGKGLAGRLILGSTTDRAMRSVRKPMMIVRAG